MKKYRIMVCLLLIFMISACLPQPGAPAADYSATIAVLSVEATIDAMEEANMLATLAAYTNQPTATCPACPTPELPTATFTQSLPTATFTPVPTATNTPRPSGGLSGSLSYPSEFIPPLRVIAFNTVTGEYYWQNTTLNQTFYSFNDLPVAEYYVLSYLIENPSDELIGAYSKAVTCGLSVACTDHSLIAVEVKQGQETKNVDLTDWYATSPADYGWPLDPTISR